MTKLFAYNVRLDEQPYIKNWLDAHKNVEFDYTNDALTDKTAYLAAGSDTVIALQTSKYTREIFQKLNEQNIKNLSVRNAGTDNIDFKAAKDFHFKISNVPSYSPNSIAEHAIIQMARLFRNLKPMDQKVEKQDFRWQGAIGREMRKQTIGILGTGHIGKIALRIAQGFGAKVIAYNRTRDPQLEAEGVYVDSVDELLKQSDGISIHIPGGEATHHLFDKQAFDKMKDDVVIVNCARGSIIDTEALIDALDSGKVSAAALDVYENEVGYFAADWQNKEIKDILLLNLLNRSNVLVSPHTAFYTTTSVEEMVEQSFDAALAFSNGEKTELEIQF